jgi:probable DNA repair protein
MDTWLRDGGMVVTASDRAARAIAAAFHRARQAEGLTAWPTPAILNWNSFVRAAWEERTLDGRLLLNPTQEQALWTDIIGQSQHMAALLEGPRRRLARLAMEAHGLLASFAPNLLQKTTARSAWQQDAAAFSNWLTAFDHACHAGSLLSPSRLPLEMTPLLHADTSERPPLLLAGFDRILPAQRSLFDAWGVWRQAAPGEPATEIRFHSAEDTQTELAACAQWCSRQLTVNPHARLLVVTQDTATRRGEIERAFLRYTGSADPLAFEFSLGIPLSQVALPRGALLLLRWLTGPIEEQELDWLLSTGQAAASAQESLALQAYMRALRRRSRERTRWTLDAFMSEHLAVGMLPASWSERMRQARDRIAEPQRRPQSPLDWAGLVPQLLETAGWPGGRPLSSAEYQAFNRWQQALDDSASLGFDARRIKWHEYLAAFSRNLEETLFAPQSRHAPIQIAGPAESAGLAADAIWFLGATEDAWPARAAAHPLLPLEVQREAGMPHATPQLDWELAHAVTTRLLASAPEVHFSFARQTEGTEARPSRLIAQFAPAAHELPQAPPATDSLTVSFADTSRVLFPPGRAGGGASVLTNQSQCPFKAFATTRLGAQGWEPAEAGLTAAQRGQLLHAVLHAVWAGPPTGIRTLNELQNLQERSSFVAGHVARALRAQIPPNLRERMPRRYLELEELRLTDLIAKWLYYEAARWPFEVLDTEAESDVALAGLALKLRLDRIDRLNDGSLLVIDYKTGDVSPRSWELPRPDDVQLPLYAGFALDPETEMLGGLVFAKVRAGNLGFAGHVGDAKATLLPSLGATSALVRNSLTAEQLIDWRDSIRRLAADFVAGRAEVDPREYPKTCERCGLQTLCRIQEHQALVDADDDSEGEETAHE